MYGTVVFFPDGVVPHCCTALVNSLSTPDCTLGIFALAFAQFPSDTRCDMASFTGNNLNQRRCWNIAAIAALRNAFLNAPVLFWPAIVFHRGAVRIDAKRRRVATVTAPCLCLFRILLRSMCTNAHQRTRASAIVQHVCRVPTNNDGPLGLIFARHTHRRMHHRSQQRLLHSARTPSTTASGRTVTSRPPPMTLRSAGHLQVAADSTS